MPDLFSVLTSKIFAGLSLALAMALIVQTVRLDITRADLEVASAKLEAAQAANDVLVYEGQQRTEAAVVEKERIRPRVENLAKQAKAIRAEPAKDDCKTPESVMEAGL